MTTLSRGGLDMTRGSIASHLIRFALPLLIGNIFQQLYNTVDSIIVGNYVGREALAAIGCAAPVTSMFISTCSGLFTGAVIVISNHFGAGDEDGLSSCVQTTVALTLILCLLVTAAGVALTPALLRLMGTNAEVFPEAESYLTIYFWGVSGLLLYNMGAGILRAVGDSVRPLLILICCAVMNTVLDIIFVRDFNWGVAGAAGATILSQFVSAAVTVILLCRAKAGYRIIPDRLRISSGQLRRILRAGIPTALQMGVTSFSNIFVQSYINALDTAYMAGWTAYTKVDGFATQPAMSLSMALTTFCGQNMGAGNYGRVRRAPAYGVGIGAAVFFITAIPMFIFAPDIVALFNSDPEVIASGVYFVRVTVPFYSFFTLNEAYMGPMRGMDDTVAAMSITLFSFVLFRQLYLYAASRLGHGVLAAALGYPSGWVVSAAIVLVYYYGFSRRRRELLSRCRAGED